MKRHRQWLLVALMSAALAPAAHADVKEKAHEAKENFKAAFKQMGRDMRAAPHAVASTAKAAGHAIAGGAHRGYDATKQAVHRAVHKDGKAEGGAGSSTASK